MRLHSRWCSLGMIALVGSMFSCVSCSATSTTSAGRRASSSCARTAMRRASCALSCSILFRSVACRSRRVSSPPREGSYRDRPTRAGEDLRMTDDPQTNAEPRFIGAQTFHDAGGVDDWRGLFWGAHAHYVTDSFADAVRLVDAIAEVVAEVGHEPDLDVRPHGVTIRTCSRPDGALSRKDVE